jgi:hypothetical protein
MKKHERAAERNFQKSLKRYISALAHERRGLTAEEYEQTCRKLWDSVKTDDIFAMKIFVEPLADFDGRPIMSDSIHCILVAPCDADGNVDMPSDYSRNDPEGVFHSAVCIGSPRTVSKTDPDNSTYMIGFFDISGFKNLVMENPVSAIQSLYLKLIEDVVDPLKPSWVKSKAMDSAGKLVPALMWCPIEVAYASDSILIYAPLSEESPGFVEEFFRRCALLFCASLRCGIPLRGALSVGPGVFDPKKRIFLGPPLVEASSLESKMDHIGICISKSVQGMPHVPIRYVQISEPPLSEGGQSLFGGLVLDWPRVWRKHFQDSAEGYLRDICPKNGAAKIRARYQHAIDFFHFSEQNSEWFNPEGYKAIEPDDWTEFGVSSE